MNDDELIFDDEEDFLEEESISPNQVEEPKQEIQEDDLTTEVLRIKGITDPEKIKFEDETGAIVERSWNQLTKEEQLNILAGEEPVETNDLSDDEIDLLNTIRDSGMSVNDYIQSLQKTIEPVVSYKIDELSDEEVYALDLLDKVGQDNITDEELTEAIENAKKNEVLFKKTVEGLRREYIQLEQEEQAQEANKIAHEQELAYNNFAASIQNEIQNLNSFAGNDLELSKEDIDELAAFMLELDDTGTSAFGKALQDPALFTKAAFWLLNEEQIIEELSKQMQDTYKRGYDAGKQDSNQPTSKLAFSPKTTEPTSDFAFDEDDW